MGSRIITGVVITIITNFILNSCHAMEVPKQILEPYSKKEESHYSYNINGNKLIINSKISDLKITKNDTDEIRINMKKVADGGDRDFEN